MNASAAIFEDVKNVVMKALGIEGRADSLAAETPLIDGIPEFDSLAVLQVILAIEEHFGITIDNEDVSGEVFETVGTLADFVALRLK